MSNGFGFFWEYFPLCHWLVEVCYSREEVSEVRIYRGPLTTWRGKPRTSRDRYTIYPSHSFNLYMLYTAFQVLIHVYGKIWRKMEESCFVIYQWCHSFWLDIICCLRKFALSSFLNSKIYTHIHLTLGWYKWVY